MKNALYLIGGLFLGGLAYFGYRAKKEYNALTGLDFNFIKFKLISGNRADVSFQFVNASDVRFIVKNINMQALEKKGGKLFALVHPAPVVLLPQYRKTITFSIAFNIELLLSTIVDALASNYYKIKVVGTVNYTSESFGIDADVPVEIEVDLREHFPEYLPAAK